MNMNTSKPPQNAIFFEKVKAALGYAKLGWYVIPLFNIHPNGYCSCGNKECRSPGKHPRLRTGLKEASNDLQQIKKWWNRWPYSNIGIVTGRSSGIFVLDIDPKNGGDDSLDQIEHQYGTIPDDVFAITGSGGKHYVFKYPGAIGTSKTNLWPGIDTRGDGGYIVAAPSNHISGNDYFWDDEADPLQGCIPAPVPGWLLEKLQEKTGKDKPDQPGIEIKPEKVKRIRSALAEIPPDDRDLWLKIGMSLHASGAENQAYDLWCEWSKQSDKFNAADQLRVWESFKPNGGIGLGSLFEIASAHGWKPPVPDRLPEPPIELYADDLAERRKQSTKTGKNKSSNKKSSSNPPPLSDKSLLKRYIFISSQNRIYDTVTGNSMTRDAFDGLYLHIFKDFEKASNWLLGDPDCIKVDGLIYLPGNHNNPILHDTAKLWNIWNDPDIKLPQSVSDQDIELWLEHLEYICPDKNEQNHFLNWLAHTLQKPQIKINHAVMLAGTPRIGKDTLFSPLRYGLGERNVCEPPASELLETYTDYLHHSKLVIFQEIMNFEGLNLENKLKSILAAPPDMLRVRLFGKGFYETPNIVQAIFMSNYRDALHISEGDGRYFAIWADVKPCSELYYRELWQWLEHGGNGLVVKWLLNRDISCFNPKEPAPMTQFKAELIKTSQSPLKHQLLDMIEAMDYPFNVDCVRSLDIVKALRDKYSFKAIGRSLSELGYINKSCRRSSGKREEISLFAVRNTREWMDKSSIEWIEEFDSRKLN